MTYAKLSGFGAVRRRGWCRRLFMGVRVQMMTVAQHLLALGGSLAQRAGDGFNDAAVGGVVLGCAVRESTLRGGVRGLGLVARALLGFLVGQEATQFGLQSRGNHAAGGQFGLIVRVFEKRDRAVQRAVELVGINIAHRILVMICFWVTIAIKPQERGWGEERELPNILHFMSSYFRTSAPVFKTMLPLRSEMAGLS